MSRTEWRIAWRYARRILRGNSTPELVALTQARAELGRPLPLRSSGTALACYWDRAHAFDELHALRARRREWEFCRWSLP